MADKNDRNSKGATRAVAQEVNNTSDHKTRVFSPMHMAYTDRSIPVYHLTEFARVALGVSPNQGK